MSKPKADSKTNGGPVPFTPRTAVDIKLAWPSLYPGQEFLFKLRIQLVEDAEKVQTEFLMLEDAEKTHDRRHQMDARMLGLISTQAPTGFSDFPEMPQGTSLPDAIYSYLYPEDNEERREGMRFICRQAMARYWAVIQPADYL